jgi:uncharacterized protein
LIRLKDHHFLESVRMTEHESNRRSFIKGASLASTAAVAAAGSQAMGQDAPAADNKAAEQKPIPRRKLGKTGVEITMLNQGSVRGQGYDCIL